MEITATTVGQTINYYPVGANLAQDTLTWIRKDVVSASVTYYGYSLTLGADPAAAVWRIRKETTASTVTTAQYADGNGNYDNIWNNRASLTYL